MIATAEQRGDRHRRGLNHHTGNGLGRRIRFVGKHVRAGALRSASAQNNSDFRFV
jgi:hypothetical protein